MITCLPEWVLNVDTETKTTLRDARNGFVHSNIIAVSSTTTNSEVLIDDNVCQQCYFHSIRAIDWLEHVTFEPFNIDTNARNMDRFRIVLNQFAVRLTLKKTISVFYNVF